MNIIKVMSTLRVCSFGKFAKELGMSERAILSKSRCELKLSASQFQMLFKLIKREKEANTVFRSYLIGIGVDKISFASLFEAGLL